MTHLTPILAIIGSLTVIFGNMTLGWLIIFFGLLMPAWAFIFDYWFGTSTTCKFNWHTPGSNPIEIKNNVLTSECSKCGRSLRKVNKFWV